MFKIRMAGLLIQVNHRYDLIREKCRDYIVETDEQPDLVMEISDADVTAAQQWKLQFDDEAISPAQAEYDRIHYSCYPSLPAFDAFWLHAAVVEMDGAAYAFTAPCGYGKSTHINLWRKVFGDKARVINGDNPIIRRIDGVFYASGTPFCGKEGYQVNTRVPLKGICFLKHAEHNALHRVDPSAAMMRLFTDNWTIRKPEHQEKHLALYEKLVECVPAYVLMCNQDVSAARVAWEGMSGLR